MEESTKPKSRTNGISAHVNVLQWDDSQEFDLGMTSVLDIHKVICSHHYVRFRKVLIESNGQGP